MVHWFVQIHQLAVRVASTFDIGLFLMPFWLVCYMKQTVINLQLSIKESEICESFLFQDSSRRSHTKGNTY